jgi:hypothetical protein
MLPVSAGLNIGPVTGQVRAYRQLGSQRRLSNASVLRGMAE